MKNCHIFHKRGRNFSKNIREKTEALKFGYKPKNAEKKEEIDRTLMHPNDMLEYRDKIIDTFRDGNFASEYLKKSDAAHNYVLKDIIKFIQKIESMAENINLSLFEDFFESSSPADYAKSLVNFKAPQKNK